MRTLIFCIFADDNLRTSLDAIALEKEFGQVGYVSHYLKLGDSLDIPVGPDIASAIAFVSLDNDIEAGLNTVKMLEKIQQPRVHVVAASSAREPDALLRIMRTGVNKFLSLPASKEDIESILNRISEESVLPDSAKGGVYLFMGASGGVGTTTIASHVAVALAAVPYNRVLFVDLHRELGHAAINLGLKNPGHAFQDVIAGHGYLDSALLSSFLVKHESGLAVLCSPDRHTRGIDNFDTKAVQRAVAFFKEHYDYIIFDGDPDSSVSDAVAGLATNVYMVVSAEVASLRDLTRYIDHLGKDQSKYHLVVTNEGRSAVTASHISSTSGLAVTARFSQVGGEVATAVNAGRTISREVKSFHDPLAEILNQIDPSAVISTPKSGLFGWRKK